jgi:protein SCO1/2
MCGLTIACSERKSAVPFIRNADLTPEWLTDREASAPSLHRVAPFNLTDQTGRSVTNDVFTGKVTIAHFFFTKCGDVCPMTTSNLSDLLRALPDERSLQVLSYSVTPEQDSVGALAQYARERNISDRRWRLLTGAPASTRALARASFFVRLGDGATYGVATIAHTESLVLIDSSGRLRGFYAGTLPLEMDRLRQDVTTLVGEMTSTR